jgi:hypothetical protein
MKAFEFHTHPTSESSIQLPVEVANQLDPALGIKVIVLVPDEEERAWTRFGMDQFAKGYAPTDSIYDDLRAG